MNASWIQFENDGLLAQIPKVENFYAVCLTIFCQIIAYKSYETSKKQAHYVCISKGRWIIALKFS